MRFVVACGLFWCGVASASDHVRINELMPDPDQPSEIGGGDPGFEWIELHNPGASSAPVGGWEIHRKTSATATAWTRRYTIPADTTIPAGGYLWIADDAQYVPGADLYVGPAGERETLGLGQGTRGDGVRLQRADGEVIDTVVYGGTNEDGIEDDSGSAATSVAPRPRAGFSLARSPNGVDTDLSGDDFILTATVTPGAANPDPPLCDLTPGVVINELLPNPDGADAGKEYVELYNGAGRRVWLEGWRLQWGTQSFSSGVTLGELELDVGAFLVIGGAEVDAADVVANLTLGNATSNADGVRLVDCADGVVDTVIYGTPNTDGWVDDTGAAATSTAPIPANAEALARRLDGEDSDRSADDFHSTPTLTPGGPNPPPPVCEAALGRVVINELLPNPVGTDAGFEWVELYNSHPSASVRLDGWTVRGATSGNGFSIRYTFPNGVEIEPGAYLLVGESGVSGADVVATLGLPNGSGGDGVRLVDCAGNVADTVVYADGGNSDEVFDDSGDVAESVALSPPEGASLARKLNGVDTDRSGDDFTVATSPTPGAPNPSVACAPSNGDVLLNELLPDPDGNDAEVATEWIELYNRGSAAVQLDGWQILTVTTVDDGAIDVTLPPGTVLAGGAFLVIGNENVAEADVIATFGIGNGTRGDAVVLRDCDGRTVDVVAYGPGTNEDGLLDEDGALATLAPMPGPDQSLARLADGVDTNAASDWAVNLWPTPGQPNTWQDGPPGGDGGCGRRGAPDADAPGGCGRREAPQAALLLPLLSLLRRRRP